MHNFITIHMTFISFSQGSRPISNRRQSVPGTEIFVYSTPLEIALFTHSRNFVPNFICVVIFINYKLWGHKTSLWALVFKTLSSLLATLPFCVLQPLFPCSQLQQAFPGNLQATPTRETDRLTAGFTEIPLRQSLLVPVSQSILPIFFLKQFEVVR